MNAIKIEVTAESGVDARQMLFDLLTGNGILPGAVGEAGPAPDDTPAVIADAIVPKDEEPKRRGRRTKAELAAADPTAPPASAPAAGEEPQPAAANDNAAPAEAVTAGPAPIVDDSDVDPSTLRQMLVEMTKKDPFAAPAVENPRPIMEMLAEACKTLIGAPAFSKLDTPALRVKMRDEAIRIWNETKKETWA